MMREVAFGSKRIAYRLQHGRRSTLAITVHADGRVVVKAPIGLDPEAADGRVRRRGAWILRQWRRDAGVASLPPQRRYVSGASHFLFGRELRLRVRRGAHATAVLARPYLTITAPRLNENAAAIVMEKWRRAVARERFEERLEALAPRVLGTHAALPAVRIVTMRRRWGSCSQAGTISLNPWLSEHPRGCVDYVILHELCHIEHLNHGPAFQTLLSRVLPDWRRWKRRLDRAQ